MIKPAAKDNIYRQTTYRCPCPPEQARAKPFAKRSTYVNGAMLLLGR
jgi:hypothetical protein